MSVDGRASPLSDSCSMTELIEIMLDELGDAPEPLQPVPEELQPMLERIQRMAEQNQMGLDPTDPLGIADQYGAAQHDQFATEGDFEPIHGHPHFDPAAYDPQGHPTDPNYNNVCQTISELCQIMTPGYQEPWQSTASYQPAGLDDAAYQPSTSYEEYPGAMPQPPPPPIPLPMPLPHLQAPPGLEPPPTASPTLRELLSPPKPKPSSHFEMQQPKGEPVTAVASSGSAARTLCRRSVADQDDPDYWLNQI